MDTVKRDDCNLTLGSIFHTRIDKNYLETNTYESLEINFELNEFEFKDPYYGLMNSKSIIGINIFLIGGDYEPIIQVGELNDIKNRTIVDESYSPIGPFTNSVEICAPLIKFGEIKTRNIEVELSFGFIMREDYTNEEININQILTKSIKCDVKIEDLVILYPKGKDVSEFIDKLDSNFILKNTAIPATNRRATYRDYEEYYVKYR